MYRFIHCEGTYLKLRFFFAFPSIGEVVTILYYKISFRIWLTMFGKSKVHLLFIVVKNPRYVCYETATLRQIYLETPTLNRVNGIGLAIKKNDVYVM